jgi:hypothetical protein
VGDRALQHLDRDGLTAPVPIVTSSSSDRALAPADNSLAPAGVTLMADCADGEVQFDRRTGKPAEANCRLECA